MQPRQEERAPAAAATVDAAVLFEKGIRPDLEILLLRTVRGLPDPLLAALVVGLERHGDDLAPGRLYRSSSHGGCAVGVMVRELHPDDFDSGRLRFWLRHRWRRSARGYGGVLATCPRVRHLEWLFDASVGSAQRAAPGIDPADAARWVGRWIAALAEAELARRHDDVPARVTAATADWQEAVGVT